MKGCSPHLCEDLALNSLLRASLSLKLPLYYGALKQLEMIELRVSFLISVLSMSFASVIFGPNAKNLPFHRFHFKWL